MGWLDSIKAGIGRLSNSGGPQGRLAEWDVGGMLPGGLTGSLANLIAQPALNSMFSSGYMPGQFTPTMGLYDRFQAHSFQQAQMQAMQEAATRDRNFAVQALKGLHTMAGGKTWGQEQQRAAEQAAATIGQFTSQFGQIAPDTVDALHGSRGSAAVMAMNVTSGLRYMRDSATGSAFDMSRAGQFSNALFDRLYGKNGVDMSGVGAGRAGQMFDEMVRRGLMPGMGDVERAGFGGGAAGADRARTADINRSAKHLQDMAKAVSAVKDLFGANGRANAPIKEIFDALDALTQGSSHWMSGGNMEAMVRRVHALTRGSAGGLDRYIALSRAGGALANQVGLDRSFGMQTAQSSLAFGNNFAMAGRQGFGGLSKDEATLLDQQLRTSAAASPMANMLGAVMSMHDQGLIKGGPAAQLVKAIQSGDPQAMAQLANMTPGQLSQMLQASGVSGSTVGTFLRGDNQEAIHRYGLGDKVRGMQAHGEVAQFLRSGLSSGMAAGFGAAGISELLPRAAEAARQALMRMDGDLLSNPKRAQERNKAVAEAIKQAIGPEAFSRIAPKIDEIVASAVASVGGQLARDPNLRKFKNIAGLISMNRGDVQSAGNRDVRRADQEADAASLTAGIGQGSALARVMDAIAGAGDDTKALDLAAQALGGVDKRQVAAALVPKLQEIQKQQAAYSRIQKELEGVQDPNARAAKEKELQNIRRDVQDRVKAVQDMAREAGIPVKAGSADRPKGAAGAGDGAGQGGDITIKGTLTLKQDGTGELDGQGGRGQAPKA